jgi:photosystem II stability/assembly factor-like uncharacterized protein
MTDKDKDIIEGSGKQPEAEEPRTPKEDPNDLQSKQYLRFIDLLCEGEISGLVNGGKSILIDEVQLIADDDDYNFGGVTFAERVGTSNQSVVPGFSKVENEISVGTQVTEESGGITKNVSDTDVDDVRFTITVPQLMKIDIETGDRLRTSVSLSFDIRPDGGSWVSAATTTITGKCTSTYARAVRVTNLSSYGAGPWEIRVTRITADSESTDLINATYWGSYTEIKNFKMIYPDTAYVAFEVDAQYFGQSMPTRQYIIKGTKIKIPDNYDPVARTYTGVWTGTFTTAYSNNPAWVMYDILTNSRYGLGIDEDKVDKWSLYTIGAYCDTDVESGFSDEIGNPIMEPRFTFNGVIKSRIDAIQAVNYIASNFMTMPYWSSGLAMFSQDAPKDPVKLFSSANVIEGNFEYSGTSKAARHTVAYITWNDPDDFFYPKVEVVQYDEWVDRYGWNPVETVAVGCTSRGQAIRYGKWILDSELYQTQTVAFSAGLYAADLLPGQIIEVADPHYAQARMGGFVVSGTVSTVILDSEIEIEAGETYDAKFVSSSGTIISGSVSNSPETTDTLTFSTWLSEAPLPNAAWQITASNLAPRTWKVIHVKEKTFGQYDIIALQYDANKFARVEEGIYFDSPPTYNIPVGKLQPPTNLDAEEYTYQDGQNPNFGCLLSWEHSPDARRYYYQIQARNNTLGETWLARGETNDSSFDLRPVVSGVWDFRVRAVGVAQTSEWLALSGFTIYADPTPLPDITGLQVKGGGTEWGGKDCPIEWDSVSGTVYRFKDYVVEVRDNSTNNLLRTAYPTDNEYTYLYAYNEIDNDQHSNDPQRDLKFSVWARDVYLKTSQNAAVLVATNPQPDYTGLTPTVLGIFNGVIVDWADIIGGDNDLAKFEVYFGEDGDNQNPLVATVDANTTQWIQTELNPYTLYYAQILPYDAFGVGYISEHSTGVEARLLDSTKINLELTGRITISDSFGTDEEYLTDLYNKRLSEEAISYTIISGTVVSGTNGDTLSGTTLSGLNWIQYYFPIEAYLDEVLVYPGSGTNVPGFVGVSTDGEAWEYFGSDGNDDAIFQSGEMITYGTNISGAYNNPVFLEESKTNHFILPNKVTMKYARWYFTCYSGVVNYNEIEFTDAVIAERLIGDEVMANYASLGVATAGIIQSANLSSGTGAYWNLNKDQFQLGGLTDPKFSYDGANMVINIDDEAVFNIEEGGQFTAGDGNILIDTGDVSASHARMIIAEDGGIVNGVMQEGKSYLLLDNGQIKSYNWYLDNWKVLDGLTKVIGGTVSNNTQVNLGWFPTQPVVQVSPKNMMIYHPAYSTSKQYMDYGVEDLEQDIYTGDWYFTPVARLIIESDTMHVDDGSEDTGTTYLDFPDQATHTGDDDYIWLPYNTQKVEFNMTAKAYQNTGLSTQYYRLQMNCKLHAMGRDYPAGEGNYFTIIVPAHTEQFDFTLTFTSLWSPEDGYWDAIPGGYSSWEEYFEDNEGLRRFYLSANIAPIRELMVFTVYASVNDGYITAWNATWAGARGAAAGNEVAYESSNSEVATQVYYSAGSGDYTYTVTRSFFDFDLGGFDIPSGYTVSLDKVEMEINGHGFNDSSVGVFEGRQSLPPVEADFDAFGTTALADAVTWSLDKNTILLNANGETYISNRLSSTYSQTYTEPRPDGAADRAWGCVSTSFNGQTMLAGKFTSSSSYLYLSTNGGSSWSTTIASNYYWYDVNMSEDGNYMLAVRGADPFHYSSNAGTTWTTYTGTIAAYSCDVSANGQVMAIAGGSRANAKGVSVSTNYGATWTEYSPIASGTYPWYNCIDIDDDGSHMIICGATIGENGRIYVSTNYGANWDEVDPVGDSAEHDWMCCATSNNNSRMLAAVQSGRLYLYDGDEWDEIYPPGGTATNKDWRSVAISDNGKIMFAAVYGGSVYQSLDYGSTWSTLSLSTAYFYDCECSSDGTYLVTCDNTGRIRKGTFTYATDNLAKFCLREQTKDVANSAPTTRLRNGMRYSETDDTTQKPVLKIYYYLDEEVGT